MSKRKPNRPSLRQVFDKLGEKPEKPNLRQAFDNLRSPRPG